VVQSSAAVVIGERSAGCYGVAVRRLRFVVLSACFLGCPDEPEPKAEWQLVASGQAAALLSVWGTSSTDVWAVGGDALDGSGPTVLHFDGEEWTRLPTGEAQGNLWWVFGFADGPVYMGGEGGMMVRFADGEFTTMATPGTGTVYGIWGASPEAVWAVGGDSESIGGFAWRLEGDAWVDEPLPDGVSDVAAIWKAYGTAADEMWLVGSNGVSLHFDGSTFTPGDTGVGSSLFTVHAVDGRYAAVGGSATGIIVENEGEEWVIVTPDSAPPGLSGVTLGEHDTGVAVGSYGTVLSRSAEGWAAEELGFNVAANLHGSWIDEVGGFWVVGGQTYSPPYGDGVLLHRGDSIPDTGL
jgi:hypothetical protein